MEIIKANGKRQKFSEEKLRSSLERVGVRSSVADYITNKVKQKVVPRIKSKEILKLVLDFLRHEDIAMAAKYNLKSAMMNLGPSGYPFEEYFARVLKENGYEVRVGETVKGFCAKQEIDIIAVKDERYFMIECKYHNSPGARSNLKVALYTYARFLDVKEAWEKRFCQAILVTNTKCTLEAIKFVKCRRIKVIAWSYPSGQNLQSLIEGRNLYPVTVLFSLNNITRRKLLKKGIVFARDLIDINIEKLSREMGISLNEMKELQDEARKIYTL